MILIFSTSEWETEHSGRIKTVFLELQKRQNWKGENYQNIPTPVSQFNTLWLCFQCSNLGQVGHQAEAGGGAANEWKSG